MKYKPEDNTDIVINLRQAVTKEIQKEEHLQKKITPVAKNKTALVATKGIKKSIDFEIKTYNIVIDAGHGGKDPGTIGSSKISEKSITLRYALDLRKKIIEKNSDKIKFKVILIRDKDSFVKVRKRVEIARKNKAHIFISLHADSCPDKNAKGSTIYFIENIKKSHKDRKYFFLSSYTPVDILKIENSIVKNLLVDLLKNKSRNNSKALATIIAQEFKKKHIPSRARSKEASFGILRGLDISASLLIEIGYLTNSEEEKKILSLDFMNKFNDSIAESIKAFVAMQ